MTDYARRDPASAAREPFGAAARHAMRPEIGRLGAGRTAGAIVHEAERFEGGI